MYKYWHGTQTRVWNTDLCAIYSIPKHCHITRGCQSCTLVKVSALSMSIPQKDLKVIYGYQLTWRRHSIFRALGKAVAVSYLAQVKHTTVVVHTEGQEMTEELCSDFRKPENPLKTERQPLGLHWPAVLRRKTSSQVQWQENSFHSCSLKRGSWIVF